MQQFQQYIRQYGTGLKRFPMAVSLCVTLFVFCSSYYMGFNEQYGKWYLLISSALTGAMFFAVLWKVWWEYKQGSRAVPSWFDAVPLGAGVLFFVFLYVTYGDDTLLYSIGVTTALGAGIMTILSWQYGESIWNFLFWQGLKCFALGTVVSISLGICLLAWNVLLFTLPSLMPLMVLHFSFCLVSVVAFLSLLPHAGETVRPDMTLGKVLYYVIFPVYIIFLLILYAYIIFIFSSNTLPVGQMNWFASLALGGFVFLYITAKTYTNTPRLSLFIRYGGVLLLPIVAAQLWCVYIRYMAYGLTEARYLSLWFTAFGVMVCIASLWVVRNRYIFLAAAVMSVIVSVTPLNITNIPYWQQVKRLQGYLADAGMIDGENIISPGDISDDDVERITSAYGYIRSHQIGHKDETTRWLLASDVLHNMTAKDSTIRIMYHSDVSHGVGVPVTGYTAMYPVDTATDNGYITVHTDTGVQKFFIEPYAKTLYDTYGERTNGLVKELVMHPDGNHALYFKTISIHFDGDGHPFIAVTGYLLVR